MEEEVKNIINELRPFLMNDGGNINFVKIEGKIVYISLKGACLYCSMQDITIKDGIERIIKERIPEIKELKVVNDLI